MKIIIAALFVIPTMTGCAHALKTPCEFTVRVKVLTKQQADTECRNLGVRFNDMGLSIDDIHWVSGCAPKDVIITDGTESISGHELKHHIDRNCL